MAIENGLLLVAEAVLYFVVLATLFRLRHRFGFGVFVCALGTMHFLETYLAAILYVDLPLGIVFSPGSSILFAGKLAMLLLVYIREDAAAVRQPIYGLLVGNFLMVALVVLLRMHGTLAPMAERAPDFQLMDDMGGMMVWGTLLLFIDAVAMILLYEKSAAWLGREPLLRILVSLAAILTFDQFGFYLALKLFVGAPVDVLVGGWVGKMFATIIYALLAGAYLRWGEKASAGATRRLTDVFDALTYRQRYEALLQESGHDGLTGVLDRGRLEADGPTALADAIRGGQALSLLVIDVDHFKAVNDRHGHAAGDDVLRLIARGLTERSRDGERVYRYGGEEFVVVAAGAPHGAAMLAAERLRRDIAASTAAAGRPVTISLGVATATTDGTDFPGLFATADRRLYEAKAAGRNRVVGQVAMPSAMPAVERPAADTAPRRQGLAC